MKRHCCCYPTTTMPTIPPTNSKAFKTYLQTILTTIISIIGLICLCSSIFNCNFISVNYNYQRSAAAEANSEGRVNSAGDIIDGYIGDGYLNSISLGIFCSSSSTSTASIISSSQESDGAMQSISKAFAIISLILSILTTLLCILISIPYPQLLLTNNNIISTNNNKKLWDIISYLSIITFITQLPILLLLESNICKEVINGGIWGTRYSECTLNNGSSTLFISMVSYISLTIYTQCVDCPCWVEEYELWKLQTNSKISRQEEEEAQKQRDVELGNRSMDRDRVENAR